MAKVGNRIKLLRRILAAGSALVLGGLTNPVSACGPDYQEAVFSYTLHPDFPLTKFAAGDLGLLSPTFANSYLIAAYRYLTDKPLNPTEQAAFMALWRKRLDALDFFDSSSPSEAYAGVTRWQALHKSVLGESPVIDQSRRPSADPNDYSSFENCPDQAFANAARTLSERQSQYGTSTQDIKDWVKAQDDVFCHCAGPKTDYKTNKVDPEPAFPKTLPAGAVKWLVQDRAYQNACAHFYAMQYGQAASAFEAIVKDANSPWQNVSALMVARCWLRKGTVSTTIDKSALSRAQEVLEKLAVDPAQKSNRMYIVGLLDHIKAVDDPNLFLEQLSKNLFDSNDANVLAQHLDDFTFLSGQYSYSRDPYGDEQAAEKPLPKALQNDGLLRWLADYKSKNSRERCLAGWSRTHSLPYLVGYLHALDEKDTIDPKVLGEAQKLDDKSPAFDSVQFELARLEFAHNRKNSEAIVDQMWAKPLTPSAKNAFARFKMLMAPDLQSFMDLAVRHPVGYVYDTSPDLPTGLDKLWALKSYPAGGAECFVDDGASILNKNLPLKSLKQAAAIKALAPVPRFDLMQSTWTRATLLKDYDTAQKLVPTLKILKPQLSALYNAFSSASTLADKQFAAFYLILKNPGSRPYVTPGTARETQFDKLDDYGDNWWGVDGLVGDRRSVEENPANAKQKISVPLPPFITQPDLKTAASEFAQLKKLGNAPNVLTAGVLAYAQAHPNDPRLPEALHRCVRASRLGTTDSATGAYSKKAFQLLHSRFGNSPWAKKTPYYYGDQH